MSDPWIKVYPADMRADPAILSLNPHRRYALIQAWDLAKNGPGAIDELRAGDGAAMTERELRKLADVGGGETRGLFGGWAALGLCTIEDGLVRFPNLAKRQGIDASSAERKRRERERKRHGAVTPESREMSRQKSRPVSRDVTGENQSKRESKPTPPPPTVTSRPRDAIWDAFAEAIPVEGEMTKSERGRRNAAAKELREIQADPDDIGAVVKHLRHKWGDRVAVTPSAVASNWSTALAELRPNGHRRKLTAEDFDRVAAMREADAAGRATEPELPY